MKYDYHVHTHLSDDAQTPMETMVQKALALGLNELCFTDHIDYGVKTDDGPRSAGTVIAGCTFRSWRISGAGSEIKLR